MASFLDLGICVLFQWNGSRKFGGSERKDQETIYGKITISVVLFCNSDSLKIASLNIFREQRELLNACPFLPMDTSCCWSAGTSLWALDLLSGLDFAKLAYQQLFTPVD